MTVKSCLVSIGAVIVALVAAPAIRAQTASAPVSSDGADALDSKLEFVVTGSRISRPEIAFANPVVSLSADQIERSGKTNIAELLARSPALVGSQTGNLTAGSQTNFGETGLNLLDLRNLGTARTLVLVDGRRHVAAEAGSSAVDIDAIPESLIEAVDVLTGGASAIYGADGVSGVVNFRTKQSFEGVATRVQAGRSSRGDGDSRFASITVGQNFSENRGNVAFAYEINSDGRVSDQDRAYYRNPQAVGLYRNQNNLDNRPGVPKYIPYRDVRYADSAPNGAVDVNGDGIPDFEGGGAVYNRGFLLQDSGGYTVGGSSTPLGGYQGDLFPKLRRQLANVLAHYDFNDSFSLFTEAKYAQSKAYSLSQPTFDVGLFVAADNPFIPATIRSAIVPGAAAAYVGNPSLPDGVLVTRDNFDLGVNAEDITRDTLRAVLGAKGRISDHAKYEISYVYGETKSRIVNVNNRITSRWLLAVDAVLDPVTGKPVCRSGAIGCIPYNIFGLNARDPAAIRFINADSVSHSTVTQHVVSGSISGDLGGLFELSGGPLGYAVGAEYRRESSDFRPDPLVAGKDAWVKGELPSAGGFAVKEVFAEINVPVLQDRRFAQLLSFGSAIRFSDYDTIGRTTTWKVDSVYAPTKAVSFRGTYSQAVRAPNIAELFAPANATTNFITDPCDIGELNHGSGTRQANCAALLRALGVDPTTFRPQNRLQAAIAVDGLASGNTRLSEETAKTWTAGWVLRPAFIPSLTLTADWYDIRIAAAINTPQAESVANLCVDQPTLANVFCGNVTRNAATGYITGFTVKPQNVAGFTTSGLDTTMSYRIRTNSLGEFNLRLVGGYLHTLTFVASPGAAAISDRRQPYKPRYVANFNLAWENGPLTLSYTVDWFDRTKRFADNLTARDPDYVDSRYLFAKEKWEHAVQFGVAVNDRVSLYVGVNNIFDEKPEFGSPFASYPVSAMGRFFYAGLKASLGSPQH